MNKKGFTLMELLAVIVLIGIITTITTVSVVSYLKGAKEKSSDILKENIKTAAINYYNECKYMSKDLSMCKNGAISIIDSAGKMTVTVSDLKKYGFLTVDEATVKDPVTGDDLSACQVEVTYDQSILDNKVSVSCLN